METLQRTANRGSISTGNYEIDNSLKFERANAEQVLTTNQAVGNKKTWTFSAWLKRTQLGQDYSFVFGSGYTNIQFMENDKLRVVLYDGSTSRYADTNQVFRDTSAFYHIVVALDSTQGTASDRVKIYINGVRVTSFSNTTYTNMSQNDEFGLGYAGSDGSERWIRLGEFFGGSEGFSGYMSDVYYLNGTAEDADAFGENDEDSGIWKPKKYTGSGFGTQGFKYEFKDSSALGTDTSGEGHNATNLFNITSADQATDTPTNNFCTFNPLIPGAGIISQGATEFTNSAGNGWKSSVATFSGGSGKWYAEFKFSDTASNNLVGVCPIDDTALNRGEAGFSYYGSNTHSIGYYSNNGQKVHNTSFSNYGNSYGTSDIISVALDIDNAKVYFAKNGTWQNSGDPTSGATGTGAIPLTAGSVAHSIGTSQYSANLNMLANYGGFTTISISSAASDANGYGTFEYAPPSGYYALCTKNLAEYG